MLYNKISGKYELLAKNQNQAAQHLLSTIPYQNYNYALDIGCGTGKLTAVLSNFAKNITGIDLSEGMIEQAVNNYSDYADFSIKSVYDLSEIEKYDLVVCNSSLHWFKDIDKALSNIFKSLLPLGILAIQTPVKLWCDLLCGSIEKTMLNNQLVYYTNKYVNPWFHLQNADEYHGFLLKYARRLVFKEDAIIISKNMSIDDVIGMFYSGPAVAYFSQENYMIDLPEHYEDLFMTVFKRVLKDIFGKRERVNVSYNRCFVIVEK